MVRKQIRKPVNCAECGNQKEPGCYGYYCDDCGELLQETPVELSLYHKKCEGMKHKQFCSINCMKHYMTKKNRVFITGDIWCTKKDFIDLIK